MKIIIEEIGDHIAISFTGKGKKSDRIKLLMMVMVETLVDGFVSDLTDAQLQDAASIFANEMKTVVIARYKMNLADRKEEFTGKEAAFLSKLFNYDRAKRKSLPVRQHGQAQRENRNTSHSRV